MLPTWLLTWLKKHGPAVVSEYIEFHEGKRALETLSLASDVEQKIWERGQSPTSLNDFVQYAKTGEWPTKPNQQNSKPVFQFMFAQLTTLHLGLCEASILLTLHDDEHISDHVSHAEVELVETLMLRKLGTLVGNDPNLFDEEIEHCRNTLATFTNKPLGEVTHEVWRIKGKPEKQHKSFQEKIDYINSAQNFPPPNL